MKETNNRPITLEQDAVQLTREEKRPWQHPSLVFLGRLGDLVRAGVKSGTKIDNDPASNAKSPGMG